MNAVSAGCGADGYWGWGARWTMVALLLTGLSGCAFTRGNVGEPLKPEAVSAIKKGSSTQAEVLDSFGAPDRVLQVNGRQVLQYYHYDAKSSSLVLILLNMSRLNIKSDDLFVFLRPDGIVDDVIFGRRTDRLKFQFWPFGE